MSELEFYQELNDFRRQQFLEWCANNNIAPEKISKEFINIWLYEDEKSRGEGLFNANAAPPYQFYKPNKKYNINKQAKRLKVKGK